jgi:hypothetical protein
LAEAAENIVPSEQAIEEKPLKNELVSLLRSLTKESRELLLTKKYNIEYKKTASLSYISQLIEQHENHKEIITDMITIKDCASRVHHENFIELCRKYDMQELDFQVHIKEAVTRCLIELPEHFHNIKVLATVNALSNFEVLKGKEIEEEIELKEEHNTEIKEVMKSYLEEKRNYIVNLEQVGVEVILTAHIEQRRKTITTISDGSTITDITLTPATKVVAKYDTKTNKIHVKGGNQKKLKDCILQTLGQVLFRDNGHFSAEQNKSYSLDLLISEDYEMSIDEELQEEVESARIIEQTLLVPFNDESVIMTVKSKDTDQFLSFLSKSDLDLSKQQRKSVTIEIVLKKAESETETADETVVSLPKTVRVTVSDDSRISFNPKYSDIVTSCLSKWGIQLGA